jgi:hypothetical protein
LNRLLTISASSSSRSSKSSATLRAPPSLPPLLRFKLLAGVVGKPVGAIKNQALRAPAARSQIKNNEQTASSITKRVPIFRDEYQRKRELNSLLVNISKMLARCFKRDI